MTRQTIARGMGIGSLVGTVVLLTAAGWMLARLEAQITVEKRSDSKQQDEAPIRRNRLAGRRPSVRVPDAAIAVPAGVETSKPPAKGGEPDAWTESEHLPGELPVQIRLRDGGSVMVKLRTRSVPIMTAYGKLDIPAEDIRSIELTLRVSADVTQKLHGAIPRLGSDKAEERAAAGAELFNLRDKSYLALVRAMKSKNKELAKRAGDLVEDLRTLVAPELLEAPSHDTIETDDSRFAGDIDLATLEVTSAQFGKVDLKLADVQSISPESRAGSLTISDTRGNLSRYEREVGRTITVRVTGMVGGAVWGVGPYSTDSSVASAVVHAGVLRQGETGSVRVQILPAQNYFQGGYRNNVMSQQWTSPHAAFTVQSVAHYRGQRGAGPPVMAK